MAVVWYYTSRVALYTNPKSEVWDSKEVNLLLSLGRFTGSMSTKYTSILFFFRLQHIRKKGGTWTPVLVRQHQWRLWGAKDIHLLCAAPRNINITILFLFWESCSAGNAKARGFKREIKQKQTWSWVYAVSLSKLKCSVKNKSLYISFIYIVSLFWFEFVGEYTHLK